MKLRKYLLSNFFTLSLTLAACTASPVKIESVAPLLDHLVGFAPAPEPALFSKLWTHRMKGLITDVDVSRDGSSILVASSPDRDTDGGSRIYTITNLDSNGKTRWELEPPAPLKSLASAEDGSLAFVSLYNDTVSAVDPQGKTVWTVENSCRPVPFFDEKKIICFHDDDAAPSVAFDAYDFSGNKIASFPIGSDVLTLKFSPSRHYFALALTHGQVVLLDQKFKVLWQKKIAGEVVDLAVSDEKEPRVVVLSTKKSNEISNDQKITVLDHQGNSIAPVKPSYHMEQIETVGTGASWAGYGNSLKGQHIEYFELTRGKLVAKWERGDKKIAEYSSSILPTPNLILFGFEDIFSNSRHSHLLGFDLAGGLKLNLPLITEEGAYLFAQAFAPEASLVIVGTDDGYLNAYRLK